MEGDGENEDMTYEQDTEDHEEGCNQSTQRTATMHEPTKNNDN